MLGRLYDKDNGAIVGSDTNTGICSFGVSPLNLEINEATENNGSRVVREYIYIYIYYFIY